MTHGDMCIAQRLDVKDYSSYNITDYKIEYRFNKSRRFEKNKLKINVLTPYNGHSLTQS